MKNKKRIIEIEVNDEYVVGSGVVIGAAGSHNDVVMKVRFNSSWADLNIIATFRDALGENPISVVLTAVSTLVESDGDHCVHKFLVPLKAKAYEGKISLSFTGYTVAAVASEDGEGVEYQETQAITSGTAYFNVLKSDAVLADDIFKTADVGQQLQDGVNTLGKMYSGLDGALGALKGLLDQFSNPSFTILDLSEVTKAIENINNFLKHDETETEETDNVFLMTYPVGSIYMSVNPTCPASLFGGTWERIKDRFILAAGDTYTSSATGGSKEHTHSLSQGWAKFCARTGGGTYYSEYNKKSSNVPEDQTFSWKPEYYSYEGTVYNEFVDDWGIGGATELGGKTDSASNMPPYLVAYIWKRTA